jgi:hypothetical protein
VPAGIGGACIYCDVGGRCEEIGGVDSLEAGGSGGGYPIRGR